MTGAELIGWIRENGDEELEVLFVDAAEIVWEVKPTVERGDEICGGGADGEKLEDGKEYIVL